MRRALLSWFGAVALVLCVASLSWGCAGADSSGSIEPLVYKLRFPDISSQAAAVELSVPTEGRDAVELMMAVWTPGSYRVENYAEQIMDFSAHRIRQSREGG